MLMIKGFFFKGLAGSPVQLSGKTYIAPPLNFKSMIEVMPLIKDLEGMVEGAFPSKKQLHVIATIIHKSLRRNYPFIRYSTVLNGLELATMNAHFSTIINGPAKPGASSGEVAAGSQ